MLSICHILHGVYSTDPRVKREVGALVEAGHQVDVVCLHEDGKPGFAVEDGANIHRVGLSRQRGSVLRYIAEYAGMFVLSSLFLARRARKYDVIHVNNMPDFLVFSTLLPKMLGTNVLLDIHDPMPELFQSKYGLGATSPVVRFLDWQERVSSRFADVVLTVSDEMRNRVIKKTGRKDVAIAMNLPDARFTENAAPNETSKPDSSVFRMLHTGTVSERYGLGMVVEAIPKLRERIPGLRLRIVGEGDQLDELRALSTKLGVDECVEFTGRVPFARIPEMIAESDIGLSALYKDCHTDLCFVTKVAEYLAMGLPVVVSRTQTMESYYDQQTVSFFDAGDMDAFQTAVMDLYEHPEKRRAMAHRGIELSATANWLQEKVSYLSAIDAACKRKRG